jgi:hypothetical protein
VNPNELITESVKGLGGIAAEAVASLVGRRALAAFTRSASNGYLRVLVPAVLAVAAVVAYVALGWPHPEWFALLSLCIVLAFAVFELSAFWRAGVQGADATIAKGLDYGKSLGLCHNELWLLGTGASKLTKEKNFEAALRRCSRLDEDGRIRFLVARPGSAFLGDAAKQAKVPHESYQETVGESLRVLALLQRDGVNLEVRFYPAEKFIPLFRLMFIDNRLCLASYNAYGHGDGSEFPQLRVARNEGRDYASFYDPFRRYFEALWESATPWSPEELLKP